MDSLSILQSSLKLAVVLAYAGFGIFLLSRALGKKVRPFPVPSSLVTAVVGAAAGLVWLWFSLHGYLFIVAVVFGVAIFAVKDGAWRSRSLVFAGIAVVVVSISLAWWLGEGPQPTGWLRPAVFAIVVWCVQAGLMQGEEQSQRKWLPLLFVLFGLAGFALLANMAQYQPASNGLALLIHHQGAYIGPALHVRAGGPAWITPRWILLSTYVRL